MKDSMSAHDVCPRCGGKVFRELDCGPDGYDDDITWTATICLGCGLWHSSWLDKWLIGVESWQDEEDAKEFYPGGQMPIAQNGIKVVWGVPKEIRVVIGGPIGRIRLRLRNHHPALAYIKTGDGIRVFVLEDLGACWGINLNLEQGRNVRNPTIALPAGKV